MIKNLYRLHIDFPYSDLEAESWQYCYVSVTHNVKRNLCVSVKRMFEVSWSELGKHPRTSSLSFKRELGL